MRFTDHCSSPKTRILKKKIITKENKYFYKSKVTGIKSEHLMPMVEGLLKSLLYKEDEYDIHLIPMDLIPTGLSIEVVLDKTEITNTYSPFSRTGSLIRVLGCPQSIDEVSLNTYALCWHRNIVQWF